MFDLQGKHVADLTSQLCTAESLCGKLSASCSVLSVTHGVSPYFISLKRCPENLCKEAQLSRISVDLIRRVVSNSHVYTGCPHFIPVSRVSRTFCRKTIFLYYYYYYYY